jgi:hypothetical protein
MAELSTINSPQDASMVLDFLEPQVLGIMRSMQLLVATITSLKAGNMIIDGATISDSIYSVEYRLLLLRSSLEESPSRVGNVSLSRALLLAHHIFLHLAIRELPRAAKMHVNMLTRLEIALSQGRELITPGISQVALQLLCWALFVGASAALAQFSRLLFVRRLWQVCQRLKIQNQEEFKQVIQDVLWMNGFCDLHCDRLWSEMMVIRIAK